MPQGMSQKKSTSLLDWQRYVKKETQRLMKGQEPKAGREDVTKPSVAHTPTRYHEELDMHEPPEMSSSQRAIIPERLDEIEENEELDKDLDVMMEDSGVELDETLEDWLENPIVEPIPAPKPKREIVKPQIRQQAKPQPKPQIRQQIVREKPVLKAKPQVRDGKPGRTETLQLFEEEVEKAKRKKSARKTREHLIENLLDPVITLDEAAVILNVCKTSVRRYTNAGKLECLRTPGNQRRFKLSTVLEFLEEKEGTKSSKNKNE